MRVYIYVAEFAHTLYADHRFSVKWSIGAAGSKKEHEIRKWVKPDVNNAKPFGVEITEYDVHDVANKSVPDVRHLWCQVYKSM